MSTDEIRKPGRVALWDNARIGILFLVVIGHMLTTTRMTGTVPYGLYVFIYLFHMPAIILLSGVFMRVDVNRKSVRSIVQLLATWVVWEVLWIGIRALLGRDAFPATFLVNSSWSLWFLFSLATMRILLPVIARLRYPVSVSIVLALVAGLSPQIGGEFSISRTLSFLPFFVVGWAAKERGWFARERFLRPTRATRAVAAGAALAIFAVAMIPALRDYWRVDKWLLWNRADEDLLETAGIGERGDGFAMLPGTPLETALQGLVIAAFLMAVAGVLTWALLVLSPRGEHGFTRWGSRTLYVYLLHGPIVQVLRKTGVIDRIGEWGLLGTATLIALGAVVAGVLATGIVAKLTKPVIEPRVDWLLPSAHAAAPDARPAAR